jgi:hypothetical protein
MWMNEYKYHDIIISENSSHYFCFIISFYLHCCKPCQYSSLLPLGHLITTQPPVLMPNSSNTYTYSKLFLVVILSSTIWITNGLLMLINVLYPRIMRFLPNISNRPS